MWIGTHQFVLQGINGVYNSSSFARGNQGFFGSVTSNLVNITITDPCLKTELNPNGALQIPLRLSIPIGESQIIKQFIGPKDSKSILYGNGFDICGARLY